ncbi:putative aldouronate transport system substrate-binding protein [Paenibacillus sp. UNC496MF]|uniref:ABC transporter substrate-binding protein n=1 Tax=Paenibacillus sp. UNC496MF TaxID=1502753 RepID=UPI0008E0DFDB|nr:ABC transporter substrate-binding protein [Paenibacillus sp. UNC496MF]SFJ70516.1 putative aldouronate transport system substrate-binding protein [Paenibacillus sp. UNC496MF]
MNGLRRGALVHVLLLGALLATACGGTAPAAKRAPANAADNAAAKLPPVELTVACLNVGTTKDLGKVQEALNWMLRTKINATVKLVPVDAADYAQKMNILITGGDSLDLMITGDWLDYYEQASRGQLLPLEDLLARYAPDVPKAVPADIREATEANGKQYAVPSIRDWAADYGYMMRKDLADKYRIDLSKAKSFAALTPIFETIVKGERMPAVASEKAGATIYDGMAPVDFDSLGDYNGVLPRNEGGKVVDMYETEAYKRSLALIRKWYLLGAVPHRLSTNKSSPEVLIKTGVAAGQMARMKPGYEDKEGRAVGQAMVAAHLSPAIATTSTVANIMWSIPVVARNPERAAMLLELLYTDADVLNLLSYGIQGVHYAEKAGNVVGFPAGVTAANAAYNPTWSWMWGNQFLTKAFEPDAADIWERQKAFNDAAVKSSAFGFNFNLEPVRTAYAAVEAVKARYVNGLENGVLDPGQYLPQFVAELKSVGMDAIVAEKQKQLDAWLAARGK